MKTLLLLVTVAISLILFVLFAISGSLLGKDTRSNLPKWISGVATLLLGAYFAFVEWDNFIVAWNKHVLGTEPAPQGSEPGLPPEWVLFRSGPTQGDSEGATLSTATDPMLIAQCGREIPKINLGFKEFEAAWPDLESRLPLVDQAVYDLNLHFQDGWLVTLPSKLDLTDEDGVRRAWFTVPWTGQDDTIIADMDIAFRKMFRDQTDFRISVARDGNVWKGTTLHRTSGVAALWEEANRVADASVLATHPSAECRRFHEG